MLACVDFHYLSVTVSKVTLQLSFFPDLSYTSEMAKRALLIGCNYPGTSEHLMFIIMLKYPQSVALNVRNMRKGVWNSGS